MITWTQAVIHRLTTVSWKTVDILGLSSPCLPSQSEDARGMRQLQNSCQEVRPLGSHLVSSFETRKTRQAMI